MAPGLCGCGCGSAADLRAARQNVALISIASVMDPALAPAGKHTLHAYLPATEPWSLWEGAPPHVSKVLVALCLCLARPGWAQRPA